MVYNVFMTFHQIILGVKFENTGYGAPFPEPGGARPGSMPIFGLNPKKCVFGA